MRAARPGSEQPVRTRITVKKLPPALSQLLLAVDEAVQAAAEQVRAGTAEGEGDQHRGHAVRRATEGHWNVLSGLEELLPVDGLQARGVARGGVGSKSGTTIIASANTSSAQDLGTKEHAARGGDSERTWAAASSWGHATQPATTALARRQRTQRPSRSLAHTAQARRDGRRRMGAAGGRTTCVAPRGRRGVPRAPFAGRACRRRATGRFTQKFCAGAARNRHVPHNVHATLSPRTARRQDA